jgi:hypothetical protein
VRAVERASSLYAIMVVRGYNGSMAEQSPVRFQGEDWLPLGTGTAVLAMALVWK